MGLSIACVFIGVANFFGLEFMKKHLSKLGFLLLRKTIMTKSNLGRKGIISSDSSTSQNITERSLGKELKSGT